MPTAKALRSSSTGGASRARNTSCRKVMASTSSSGTEKNGVSAHSSLPAVTLATI
jgi:hypothetical protein